jgi:hypothetical protein
MGKDPCKIIEKFYQRANKEIKRNEGKIFLRSLNDGQKEWLNSVIDNAESFKAVLTVLTTNLIKKNRGSQSRC